MARNGKTNRLLSREELAGYESKVIRKGRALIAGQGAGGQNLQLALRLVGVQETFLIDFDKFDRSNSTRSPFFPSPAERAR